jgi:hypothetical protein
MGLILLLVLNIVAISKGAYLNQLLSTIMFAAALYPSWRYLRYYENNVPLLPVFAFVYWLAFGLQVFVPLPHSHIYLRLRPDQITYSLSLATIALEVFLLAFYLFPAKFMPRLPKAPDVWNVSKAKLIGWSLALSGVLFSIGTIVGVAPDLGSQKGVFNFVITLSLLGTGILFLLLLKGQLRADELLLFWFGLVPLHVMTWWGEGGAGSATVFVLVLALIYLRQRLRVPVLWGLVIGLAVVSLISFRSELRGLSSYGVDPESVRRDPVGRVVNFFNVNADFYQRFSVEELNDRTAAVVNRVDQLGMLAYVVQQTPGVVPYWGGETYKNFLWKLFPRPIFSGKPLDNVAATFPRRYAVADPSALAQTTIPMPFLAEFYANFGAAGILLGMVALALVYRMFYRVFNEPGVTGWSCVCTAALGAFLIKDIGANLSLVYGGLLWPGIAIWMLGYFVRGRTLAAAPVDSTSLAASGVAANAR